MSNLTPTERLDIVASENANEEILKFADDLISRGARPWFEVWYPAPKNAEDGDWAASQSATFDAVEVIDRQIHTLPSYKTLRGEQ